MPLTVCFILLLTSCVSTRNRVILPEKALFDTTAVSKYRVLIKANQAEISGIMVVKFIHNEWRGSLINEFGIKAFDFVAPRGRCKLQNTIPFLNKWYIRKTVEDDFAFLFWNAASKKIMKGKRLEQSSDDKFVLKNEKRAIEYSFQSIEE
jgi:hypothetical protein